MCKKKRRIILKLTQNNYILRYFDLNERILLKPKQTIEYDLKKTENKRFFFLKY